MKYFLFWMILTSHVVFAQKVEVTFDLVSTSTSNQIIVELEKKKNVFVYRNTPIGIGIDSLSLDHLEPFFSRAYGYEIVVDNRIFEITVYRSPYAGISDDGTYIESGDYSSTVMVEKNLGLLLWTFEDRGFYRARSSSHSYLNKYLPLVTDRVIMNYEYFPKAPRR